MAKGFKDSSGAFHPTDDSQQSGVTSDQVQDDETTDEEISIENVKKLKEQKS